MTDQLKACREAFEERCASIEWGSPLAKEQAYCAFSLGAEWNTSAQADAGEAVACWSLAHKDGGGPLFADCIYDNKEDAQLDADALNGEHGGLVPVPLYTHPPRAQEAGEDARDAARYRWLRTVDNGRTLDVGRETADGYVEIVEGRALDEAIDAALSARGEAQS